VAELRERKQREAKPFAVMGLNAASLADFARVGKDESELLHSVAAPIVLCPKARANCPASRPVWPGSGRCCRHPAAPVALA
jgi:hydrogenase maturation protein HypF